MKKSLGVLRKSLVISLVVLAASMMLFTVFSTAVVGKKDKSFLGYKMFTVLSDSMADTFKAGDLVVCTAADTDALQAGDIITFVSSNPDSYGEIITHKIRERVKDKGQDAFITYGTTTNSNDQKAVTCDRIIGKYEYKIPRAGNLFQFLKSPPGYVLLILIPFAALIFMQGAGAVKLYKQYKKERADEQQDDGETHDLLEQIRTLKQQIEGSRAALAGESADTPDPADSINKT